jgi:hypothetical protein
MLTNAAYNKGAVVICIKPVYNLGRLMEMDIILRPANFLMKEETK